MNISRPDELLINNSQTNSFGAALNPFSPSLYLCLGLPWPRCRTSHLALLNFMWFTQAPLLQPCPGPSGCIPSLQHADRTTQFSVSSKLAEGALISLSLSLTEMVSSTGLDALGMPFPLLSTWTLSYWPQLFQSNYSLNSLSTEWCLCQICVSPD